jgi:hypothetical protein
MATDPGIVTANGWGGVMLNEAQGSSAPKTWRYGVTGFRMFRK